MTIVLAKSATQIKRERRLTPRRKSQSRANERRTSHALFIAKRLGLV